jgi:RNA 2',3'-cyclic 3'-phosphodiesterase
MRLFVALDIEDSVRQRIVQFMDELRELAPGAKWVNPESLHITLKFIGERPDSSIRDIESVLSLVRGAEQISLAFRGTGFFPTAKAARVFWVGIHDEQELMRLAREVEQQLLKVGIPEEKRSFGPHLTLARAGGGSGAPGWRRGDKADHTFSRLQEKLAQAPAPDFGTMTAREFFLYRSQLSSKGARYTRIARFELQSPRT